MSAMSANKSWKDRSEDILRSLYRLFGFEYKSRNRVVGLFVSHIVSDRVEEHFSRLKRESGNLIGWYFLKTTNITGEVAELPLGDLIETMPRRRAEMLHHGGYLGGFLDTLIVPYALAANAELVWVMEYDVDFSGNWHDFFVRYQRVSADLLTTTVFSRDENPHWAFWPLAKAPHDVPTDTYHRSFHPIMRISRRFAADYAQHIEGDWTGHSEFTLPTSALSRGFVVEDLGGLGKFCPRSRRGKIYSNTHTDEQLKPGTFVWRPSMSGYFHEDPGLFSLRNFLYHPVKPDIVDWDKVKGDGLA